MEDTSSYFEELQVWLMKLSNRTVCDFIMCGLSQSQELDCAAGGTSLKKFALTTRRHLVSFELKQVLN